MFQDKHKPHGERFYFCWTGFSFHFYSLHSFKPLQFTGNYSVIRGLFLVSKDCSYQQYLAISHFLKKIAGYQRLSTCYDVNENVVSCESDTYSIPI